MNFKSSTFLCILLIVLMSIGGCRTHSVQVKKHKSAITDKTGYKNNTPPNLIVAGKFGLMKLIYGPSKKDFSLFCEGDILDWQAFLGSLKEHKTPEKKRIWDLIGEENRKFISSRDWQPKYSISVQDMSSIITALNRILKDKNFYTPTAFKNIKLSKTGEKLLKKGLENLNEYELQRFNRLLFESIYLREIAKSYEMTYKKEKKINLPDVKGAVSLDNYIFVNSEGEIIKINDKLEKTISKKFKNCGAMATDGTNLFISADNSFIALDENLKELSRVNLFEAFKREKNAHDIIIYNGTAYLLDNCIIPMYILRMDIRNPGNIELKEKIIIEDINPHLVCQWLNPELDRWAIVQAYSHRGGNGQNVRIFSMKEGKEECSKQRIFESLNFRKSKKEGTRIKAVTALPPTWALVQSVEDKYQLAGINSKNGKISFSKFLDLNELNMHKTSSSARFIIKRAGNYLLISHGMMLIVINIKGLRSFSEDGTRSLDDRKTRKTRLSERNMIPVKPEEPRIILSQDFDKLRKQGEPWMDYFVDITKTR